MNIQKTYQPKAAQVARKWHLVDAKGKILGRMASDIATILMGKKKTNFSNHMDMGDYVVVLNAAMVDVTGKKKSQKVYYSHSGFPKGFKETKYSKLIVDQPEKIIEMAVKGMLPKNRLQRDRMKRLKVFPGSEYPYGDKFKKSE